MRAPRNRFQKNGLELKIIMHAAPFPSSPMFIISVHCLNIAFTFSMWKEKVINFEIYYLAFIGPLIVNKAQTKACFFLLWDAAKLTVYLNILNKVT
jgi:hypothetical protein